MAMVIGVESNKHYSCYEVLLCANRDRLCIQISLFVINTDTSNNLFVTLKTGGV